MIKNEKQRSASFVLILLSLSDVITAVVSFRLEFFFFFPDIKTSHLNTATVRSKSVKYKLPLFVLTQFLKSHHGGEAGGGCRASIDLHSNA